MCFLFGVTVLVPKKRAGVFFITILMIPPFVLTKMPEIKSYTIDKNKGWEWIPGARRLLSSASVGTFEINVIPAPEFP